MTLDRRAVLGRLACTGASLALAPLVGCGARSRAPRPRSDDVRVDASFARLVFELLDHDTAHVRARLLDHAALKAIVRHQRLAGNAQITGEDALARLLESARRTRPTPRALEAWAQRDRELAEYVVAAARYLPPEHPFTGTVYFVVGYDIGVASPPDIILNVGHEHFVAAPQELGFYATHEAHHVGFMTLRRAPALTQLNDARHLRAVIRYMTQLEGTGVHAAFPLRQERGGLGADRDYRIYGDAAEARRVTAQYAELTRSLSDARRVSDQEVGAILTAMSSGERIWYQFGALACWTLERTRGRGALVASITNPALFDRVVSDLLTGR